MTDWEEVGVEHWIENGLITYDVSGNIMLPTIEQCMRFVECSYVEEGLERFQSDYGINFGAAIAGARVLPILSDPTRIDSDGDGIDDLIDPRKLDSSDIKTNCLYKSCFDDYDDNDAFNHNYEFLKQDGNYRVCVCINCKKIQYVPYYIDGHIYGAHSIINNDASEKMQAFEIISSDISNDFGYIKYNGEIYPIQYFDYTEGSVISPIYYEVASYSKSEIKFDFFEGVAGVVSEDIITIDDSVIYTGKTGSKNFQYKIQPSNEKNVAFLNSFLLIKYFLQVAQVGSTNFRINYIVGKTSDGNKTAVIRVDISKLLPENPDVEGSPLQSKVVAQMLIGIDNYGGLYNVYSKLVE
ncbi:MAG: hypothetical protein HDT47_04705 [Ruminococcaceae bacterium]|nr:hypothetical protein [Oscillospiraceae bacterium]